ncbi:MAG: hypothetical protein UH853_02435 [Muribaculaceae bacterium]|nr:hypothetical protein [Muribaculaceae bacterium]
MCVVSCSGDKATATKLLEDAKLAITQQKYHQAVALLDSIDKAYASQVDVRRQAMNVRPQAIEGMTLREIEKADSALAVAQAEFVNLKPLFQTVSDARLVEPYMVAKTADKSILEKTGIQARLTPDGDFYVISSLNGKSIKHTSVGFVADGQSVSTSAVAYDGDRNYRSNGSEIITFVDSECDTLGVFASNHDHSPITLVFKGSKSHSVKMSAKEVKAFADTYRYSLSIKGIRTAMRRKEFLDQQLMVARNQIARTMTEQ